MITALICLLLFCLVWAIYIAIGFIHKPDEPTAVIGFVSGDLRLENGAGDDYYQEGPAHVLWFLRPEIFYRGLRWAITHIQYRSHFGFYLAYPAGFYFWLVWKLQATEPNPNAANDPAIPTLRVPGSEHGFVFRLPGWRWSAEGYVFTKGQAGLHYD